MDALSKLGRALAVIRRANQQPLRRKSDASSPAAGQQPDTRETRLRAQVAARVRAIGRQDPNFRSASVRAFLEQVLLDEFGKDMLNSQDFQETVRHVQRVMEGDAAMRMELDALVEQLFVGPDQP